jgi:hypothetical protein
LAATSAAAIGGAEIGPFTVTEFAILDATGACCVVGTTDLQKTVSSQGQTSDLAFTAAIVVANSSAVTVTPPSAGYATMGQVIAAYNSELPGAAAPIIANDTLQSNGWLKRIFGISPASQPADAVTAASSAAAMGSGRPASAAEWTNGQATAGGFAWPWPTLQQVTAAFAAVVNSIATLGASLAGYLKLSGGTMSGALVLAADPTQAPQAATKNYVDSKIAGIAIPNVSGFLPVAGGAMTGPLITARDPQSAMEAANKEYVDGAVAANTPFTETGVGALLFAQGGGTGSTYPSGIIGTTCTFGSGFVSTPVGGSGWTLSGADNRWTGGPAGTWKIVAQVSLTGGGSSYSGVYLLERIA